MKLKEKNIKLNLMIRVGMAIFDRIYFFCSESPLIKGNFTDEKEIFVVLNYNNC